jgi:hypothetical protein
MCCAAIPMCRLLVGRLAPPVRSTIPSQAVLPKIGRERSGKIYLDAAGTSSRCLGVYLRDGADGQNSLRYDRRREGYAKNAQAIYTPPACSQIVARCQDAASGGSTARKQCPFWSAIGCVDGARNRLGQRWCEIASGARLPCSGYASEAHQSTSFKSCLPLKTDAACSDTSSNSDDKALRGFARDRDCHCERTRVQDERLTGTRMTGRQGCAKEWIRLRSNFRH